jgi:hypothetical protein
MSNTKRQRQFRKNHPGYFAKYRRRRRKPVKPGVALFLASAQAAAEKVEAIRPAPPVVAPEALPAIDPQSEANGY